MKRLLSFISLVFIFLVATAGISEAAKEKQLCVKVNASGQLLGTGNTGVALNGAAGTRTFTVDDLDGFDQVTLGIQFTHANNGTLSFTCTGVSPTALGVTSVSTTLTTCSVSAGNCTLNLGGVWTTATTLTADTDFNFPIGVTGEEKVTCVVAHGGTPAAGDTIIVTGRKCVK